MSSSRNLSDLQEKLGRIDERTLITQKELCSLKEILEQHSQERRANYSELEKLIRENQSLISKKIQDNEKEIVQIKRDRTWMYGIFMLFWTGLIGWIKSK
jgi:hypothetical protein